MRMDGLHHWPPEGNHRTAKIMSQARSMKSLKGRQTRSWRRSLERKLSPMKHNSELKTKRMADTWQLQRGMACLQQNLLTLTSVIFLSLSETVAAFELAYVTPWILCINICTNLLSLDGYFLVKMQVTTEINTGMWPTWKGHLKSISTMEILWVSETINTVAITCAIMVRLKLQLTYIVLNTEKMNGYLKWFDKFVYNYWPFKARWKSFNP